MVHPVENSTIEKIKEYISIVCGMKFQWKRQQVVGDSKCAGELGVWESRPTKPNAEPRYATYCCWMMVKSEFAHTQGAAESHNTSLIPSSTRTHSRISNSG